MADKIAKEDITQVNEAGQTVVLVPAGQPIPDDLDAKLAATVPHRHADDIESSSGEQKKTQDKARRSSRQK